MNDRPRVREFGISLGQLPPGKWNAITDVPGVRVGHTTLIYNAGETAVRTGVTVILPHGGNPFTEKTLAAVHTINGHGKATGFEQIRELGVLETPIALTNTLNTGLVWDALVSWTLQRCAGELEVWSVNPFVGECNDSFLNDIHTRSVHEEHVFAALQAAASGPVEEGAVGAGTGMTCCGFKSGVGTASRLVGEYTLGALVVSNFGERRQLRVDGVPVGEELANWPEVDAASEGSIMIILATDGPLNERQLGRLARRAGAGIARIGSTIGSGSGDFALAFSTAQRVPAHPKERVLNRDRLAENAINPFFQAAVEAVEEAILNSLFKAADLSGRAGHTVYALPLERVGEIMQRFGRTIG